MKNKIHKTRLLIGVCLIMVIGVSNLSAQGWMRYYTDSTWYDNPPVTTVCQKTSNVIQGHSLDSEEFRLVRVDAEGTLLWEKTWFPFNKPFIGATIISTNNGEIVVGGDSYVQSQGQFPIIFKTDANGNELWEVSLAGPRVILESTENDEGDIFFLVKDSSFDELYIIGISKSGTVLLDKLIQFPAGYDLSASSAAIYDIDFDQDQILTATISYKFNVGNSYILDIIKMDSNGTILSSITIGNNITSFDPHKAAFYPNGDILLAYQIQNLDELRLRKMASDGTVLWDNLFQASAGTSTVEDLAVSDDGIYMIGDFDNNFDDAIFGLTTQGNFNWVKSIDGFVPKIFKDIQLDADGNTIVGAQYVVGSDEVNAIIKLDGQGNVYSGFIKGKVSLDKNQNCTVESTDIPIPNYKVISNGGWLFMEYTDAQGNYIMNVDTGSIEVKTIPNNPLNSSCSGPITIHVSPDDTVEVNFLERPSVLCPNMVVDISTPFLRRCFENIYYVEYCNNGTAMANDAHVEITLDPYLTVLNSSIPIASQTGNTLLFELGDVDIFECGSFTIRTKVDCDSTVLGQTHCVEAHIFPDSICVASATSWDGSITELSASCELDSVLFEIRNIGTGAMSIPQNYVVTEDDIIKTSFTYQLFAGDALSFKFPANGQTFRLTANQSPGHFPANYVPTIAIEGCGFDNTTNQYSTGFVTQFSEDDILDFLSIDCQENIGSFDPNDKRAEPKGYGSEHFIEENTDIEYHIRFQNVGTDTAFTVVIRDEISPHLDVSSIRLGVSSHPYDFSLENGRIMKLTFNDIDLVDSTTNEPGSHGFLKFKISQQPNLPIGTVINNEAAIYFDFNEPVITNTTFHEIGEDFIQILINNEEVTDYPAAQVLVYPNPFSDAATLEVIDGPGGAKTFELYDALGRAVLKDQFETRYQLSRRNLLTGVYFFTIQLDGNNIKQGKLIIQ